MMSKQPAMTETASGVLMLEAKFKKADSDLDHLTRKLELRCHNHAAGDDRKNPLELLRKVNAVKSEFKAVMQEAAEIQKAQEETMEYFKTCVPVAIQALQQLQQKVGMMGSETDKARVEELANLLDIQVSSVLPLAASTGEGSRQTSGPHLESSQPAVNPAEEAPDSSLGAEGQEEEEASPVPAVVEDPVKARAALRAHSQDVVDLSQEELESVSELIRGRVKLADVNAVYRSLYSHFKKEGNSGALTSSDMYKMGMRVTGATGQAKLKVLRALKLLTISTKGDVKLL